MSDKEEKYQVLQRLHQAEGNLNYLLAVFGDHLAEREGYKALDGIEAVYFYLVNKFNWMPSQVRAMNYEDIRFALTEEMSGWQLPENAR